jgi:hypothetical protein
MKSLTSSQATRRLPTLEFKEYYIAHQQYSLLGNNNGLDSNLWEK